MKRSRIGVRVSAEFRSLIARHGELSAASQALMLIGAAALGAPLASVAADLLWLEQQDVSAEVKQQLRFLFNQMFNKTSNNVLNSVIAEPPAPVTIEEPPEELPNDPFLSAGIEV